jgi:hypothetical protein
MTKQSIEVFVDELVRLLVEHFGLDLVRASLARLSIRARRTTPSSQGSASAQPNRKRSTIVPDMLEQLQHEDAAKHGLLAGFYDQVRDKTVLPEPQDIRYFAQVIGLKDISGRSRKEMVPKLMRFLLDQPVERLQIYLDKAPTISERHRRKGFEVITEKLLPDKPNGGS